MVVDPRKTAECLVAYGAPLAAYRGVASKPPEEALMDGLALSHEDATVLRVLPVVIARNHTRLDFERLRMLARQGDREAELGMLLELTAEVAGLAHLAHEARKLKKPERPPCLYLRTSRPGRFGLQLAEERTPAIVRSWGFLMNMSLDCFRELLSKARA
jgi:hypothetical protein